MAVTYKDIDLLTQKANVAGTEKLPVSETEYITPEQITGDHIGFRLRTNSMDMRVSGVTYRYRLLFTSADGTRLVPANTSTSTNATDARSVNQTKIDPFGAIRYYGSTTAISSGGIASATTLWQQCSLMLGYSFNRTGTSLSLATRTPVYIKCAPQTDGSAIIDADIPFVQSLPTTADGKIYIYLGVAHSASSVEMTVNHPVYYHDGTGVHSWSGFKKITISSSEPTSADGNDGDVWIVI